MTRLFAFITTLLLQSNALIAEEKFVLHGLMDANPQGIVYLKYYKDAVLYFDSASLKSGEFSFSGMLSEPNIATISYRINPVSARKDLYADFLLEPGQMELSVDVKNPANIVLKGSKANAAYQILKQGFNPIIENVYRLKRALEKDSLSASVISDSIRFYKDLGEKFLSKFITEHHQSTVSVNAMSRRLQLLETGPDSSLQLFRTLDSEVLKSSAAQKIILGFERTITSAVGHQTPDFTRTDVNGKEISLNQLQGKYVLLEYWASWCLPCRELTPQMKEFYNQYHDKGLEIIYISCDSKYTAWQKAITDDKVEKFINVLSFTKEDMEFLKTHTNEMDASFKGELRKLYNLMPIPSEILIDPSGKIIGRYRGLDSEPGDKLAIKLKEIFP